MISRGCAPEVCCKPRKPLPAYAAAGCDGWVCSLMQWLLTLGCVMVSIAFAWLGFQQMAPILAQAPCMTDYLLDDATQLIASISNITDSTGTTLDVSCAHFPCTTVPYLYRFQPFTIFRNN